MAIEVEVFETLGAELETTFGESGTGKRRFAIRGAQTPEAANNAFIDFVLANYRYTNGVPAKRFRLTESKEHGNIVYEGEVEYKVEKNDKNEDEESGNEFTLPTFSLRGGKKRVVRPLGLTARVTQEGAEEVDYKMIGWNGEEFTGCEVDASDLTFMVPQLIPARQVNFALIRRLDSMIGTINTSTFYGLSAGQVMYLGPEQSYKTLSVGKDVEGNEQYQRFVELQHHFKCQPNLYGVRIGDCPPVDIPGWDYVDVHYRKELHDIGDGKLTELAVPVQVDVWRVCYYSEFSLLTS